MKSKITIYIQGVLLLLLGVVVCFLSTSCDSSESGENLPNWIDPVFAKVLQERGYIKDATKVTPAEVKNIREIYINGSDNEKGTITSLRGLEEFSSLTILDCSNNRISSLDVSHNTKLTSLDCSNNYLNELNLEYLIDVQFLWCQSNSISKLNLLANVNLYLLDCRDNNISDINLSSNPQLIYLYCSGNHLTNLDIGNNINLSMLEVMPNSGVNGIFKVLSWFDNSSLPNENFQAPGLYNGIELQYLDIYEKPQDNFEMTINYNEVDLITGYNIIDSDSELQMISSPKIIMTRNFSASLITCQIESLITADGKIINLTIPNLFYEPTVRGQLIANSDFARSGNYTIKNISFIGYLEFMSLQFELDKYIYVINVKNPYSIFLTPAGTRGILYNGITKVKKTSYEDFSSSAINYIVSFYEDRANIYIINARFNQQMPEINMNFVVNYKMFKDHYELYYEDSIIPYDPSVHTPYFQYLINSFQAYLPFVCFDGSLSFTCTEDNWTVNATNLKLTTPLN